MTSPGDLRWLVVTGGVSRVGGLGLQADFALRALTEAGTIVGVGPDQPKAFKERNVWTPLHPSFSQRLVAASPLRWFPGLTQEVYDKQLSREAARVLASTSVSRCYAFTGVALDAFGQARSLGLPCVLDSPNGHILNFRSVLEQEAKSLSIPLRSPPTRRMVARIQREYELATTIRVSSRWAKLSLISNGIPAEKIHVQDLDIDTTRFSPIRAPRRAGPFRLLYVGSVDLRKGVLYLLRALRLLERDLILKIVGATGDRPMRRLFQSMADGLRVEMAPGDPAEAYREAELFVLPSLEDGFGYVVAEAMASGLPVIVTDQCGSAEWVSPGHCGWIVRSRSPEDLAKAIGEAIARRDELPAMGLKARDAVLARMTSNPVGSYATWLRGNLTPSY
jgi:glycosyltransferase involved in cell wall biosynthesis